MNEATNAGPAIRAALADALENRDVVAVVTVASGAGKTREAEAVAAQLAAEGCRVVFERIPHPLADLHLQPAGVNRADLVDPAELEATETATDRVWRALEARRRYMMEGHGAAILATEGVPAYLAEAAVSKAAWCVESAEDTAPLGVVDRAFCEAIVRADAAGWAPAAGGAWHATGAEVAAAYGAEGPHEAFYEAAMMAERRGYAFDRTASRDHFNPAPAVADLAHLATAAAACRLRLAIDKALAGLPETAAEAACKAAAVAVCEQWIANDPGAAAILSAPPT